MRNLGGFPIRPKLAILGRRLFLDPLCGGAWPLLVGGVICLVDSVNERDLRLLNSCVDHPVLLSTLLRGTLGV